jgi:SAM-dependent methyltransferase
VKRIIKSEILDLLPPDDPRAIHSRRDLRRINGLMGNHHLMAEALQKAFPNNPVKRITEIGAGDGEFLFRVAQKIDPRWANVQATLIDLQKNVSQETLAAFASLGWNAEAVVADVFDWPQMECDVVVANLFLHHFDDLRLAELLRMISCRTKLFIVIEPRRAPWPLFCSRLLWAIGCNAVTCHDAVISVRAGFCGDELSALWPEKQGWQLTERPAGAFSHLFIAQKTSQP